jgi:hypothetical protein
MQEQFSKGNAGKRSGAHAPLDLEADWSYLRANLDHPAHRLGGRLGSGLADWLLRRLHSTSVPPPQLSILARIALSPRQSLTLVEVEGIHVLVGSSADGPPSFFRLSADGPNSDSESDRAWERMMKQKVAGTEALGAGKPSRSAPPWPQLSGPGTRQTGRMRLAGRVSWV